MDIESIKTYVNMVWAYVRCQIDTFLSYIVKDAKIRGYLVTFAMYGVLLAVLILAVLAAIWILREMGIIRK